MQQRAGLTILASLKDILFPACCLGCQQPLGTHRLPLLCPVCFSLLVPIRSPYCIRCGIPFAAGVNHLCGDCLASPISYDLAHAPFLYAEPLVSLILQWKFGGKLNGLASMVELALQSACMAEFTEPDIVVPVPLHKKRLRHRGFNQSLQLARGCFPQWRAMILADGLRRLRPTVPQVSLSGADRRKNIRGAFSLKHKELVREKNVLLVDDVFTTGSTVTECSQVLRMHGAQRVEVFTLARSL